MAAILVAIICIGEWNTAWQWVGIIGFPLFIGSFGGWRSAVFIGLTAILLSQSLKWRDGVQARDEARFAKLGIATAEAVLLEDAVGSEGSWSATARLNGAGDRGEKVRWSGSGTPPPAGTFLKAAGEFHPFTEERNPGTLDRAKRLRNEGVVAIFRANGMRSEQWVGPISGWGARIKGTFRKGIVAGLDEDGSKAKLIRAVVLGEKSPDSVELMRNFRESGTLHVFTVSGLHVAMVGGMIWFLLKWIGLPLRWAVPVICAGMFGYVWLTGSGAAATRAAWMGTVFLGAFVFRRKADLLNSLGLVMLLMLVWDPRMIRMPGVQLSYGVVSAIGLGTVAARRFFSWIAEEEDLLPKSEMTWWQRKWLTLRQKLAGGLAVSLAASIGSAPLTIFHFGIVTPISVIATVVLVVQVHVMLAVALGSAMIYPIWDGGAKYLNTGNAVIATLCGKTAGMFASIPGAWASTDFPERDTLVIYDLDFGASAACFASTTRNAVLIDSGGNFNLRREIGSSLRRLGLEPDSVIFTHADSGHIAGIEPMLEMFPLKQVALGVERSGRSVAEEWAQADPADPVVILPRTGDRIELGGNVRADVLLSPHDKTLGSLADDRVMVLMLHWHEWKLLWMSDAGRLSERELLGKKLDLKADLIISGLHESDLSLGSEFVAAVDPAAIVIARPAGSEMDRLRESQVTGWVQSGRLVIDQKSTGGLTISRTRTGGLLIEGYLDGSQIVLRDPSSR
ncbi:ComEC/Rec2 family competence protein [Luteolibacter algae]|uniref:ComEC/Rec2 family competence protein n=1 Tax=Luteolibacter algae TaxID=454151 RepID=A0ABW5D6E2_9BACT